MTVCCAPVPRIDLCVENAVERHEAIAVDRFGWDVSAGVEVLLGTVASGQHDGPDDFGFGLLGLLHGAVQVWRAGRRLTDADEGVAAHPLAYEGANLLGALAQQ